ncbi:MAG: TadE family protein [Thermoguttaceae bacterium]
MRPYIKKTARQGAVVVELALLSPLLCTLTLGMMEMGRGSMVCTILSTAARNGAQVAALPTSSNATVISRINNVLTANNITAANATITILVNGAVADVSSANANAEITVTVSIPASQTCLTNFSVPLLQNTTFSATLTMIRLG